MEIENIVYHGQSGIEFTDRTGTPCTLWILFNTKDLRFDLDTDFTQFTREDIAKLLPYLQAFAETGTLEPVQDQMSALLQKKHLSTQESIEVLNILQGDEPAAESPSIKAATEYGNELLERYSDSQEVTESPLQGEEYTLKQLADFQERIQHAFHQETKDCVLCQTVILLSRFASNEIREKAFDLLRTYNAEERIAHPPLQGEEAKVALQIMATQKEQEERIQALTATTARMNYRNYRYEQLLKEWKNLANDMLPSFSKDELLKKTDELIEERVEITDLLDDIAQLHQDAKRENAILAESSKYIKELKQLVEEWSKFGECVGETKTDCKSVGFLQKKTAQLLGKESQNDPTS